MFNFLRTREAGRRNVASITRPMVMVALAAATFAVSACSSERVAGPSFEVDAQAKSGLITNTLNIAKSLVTKVTALRWSTTVAEASASKVIGAAGGTITAPGGLTLVVPKGAVSANTTFKVTRLAGNIVAYEFEPHGTTFAEPLTITQSTAGTNFNSFLLAPLVRGAYFADKGLLDQLAGTALVNELRAATVDRNRTTVTFTVNHFSGYMVSMD